MYDILRISRIDDDARKSWLNNVSMIVASDSSEYTESLIKDKLLKDYCDDDVIMSNGEILTREFISIEKLGTSSDIKPGILLIDNAGA